MNLCRATKTTMQFGVEVGVLMFEEFKFIKLEGIKTAYYCKNKATTEIQSKNKPSDLKD